MLKSSFANYIILAFVFLIISIGCEQPPSKLDTVKPIITLIGEHTIVFENSEEYENYIDLGATAIDKSNGDITDKIEVSLLLSTSTDLEYSLVTFVYDVEDSDGNKADSVHRNIVVHR